MSDERELLRRTAELAGDFIESLDERRVFPDAPVDELAAALGGPFPEKPSDPLRVVEELARAVEPGVVATAGGRYFGYVIGGALPATVGADGSRRCGISAPGSERWGHPPRSPR